MQRLEELERRQRLLAASKNAAGRPMEAEMSYRPDPALEARMPRLPDKQQQYPHRPSTTPLATAEPTAAPMAESNKEEVEKAPGSVIVPCRARGMPMDHNFKVRPVDYLSYALLASYHYLTLTNYIFVFLRRPTLLSQKTSSTARSSSVRTLHAETLESSSAIVPTARSPLRSATSASATSMEVKTSPKEPEKNLEMKRSLLLRRAFPRRLPRTARLPTTRMESLLKVPTRRRKRRR
jgi:hypothetical protein